MRPSLKTVSVAIDAVLHDVPAMYQTFMVNLPEDDVASAGSPDMVVVIYAKHLF